MYVCLFVCFLITSIAVADSFVISFVVVRCFVFVLCCLVMGFTLLNLLKILL